MDNPCFRYPMKKVYKARCVITNKDFYKEVGPPRASR